MIQTENLTLVPHGPDHLLTLIERPEEYEARTGFPAAPGLREFFVSGEVSQEFVDSMRSLSEPDPWRLGFAVVHREERMVIGSGGFKGPPDSDGMVEIAYGIAPSFQRRGYATEVAKALVDYALGTDQCDCSAPTLCGKPILQPKSSGSADSSSWAR